MKLKKYFILAISGMLLAGSFSSCELDLAPTDSLTSEQLKQDPQGAVYATSGNYSMLKDIMNFKGVEYTANTFIRHHNHLTEYPSDNISLSGRTTDPLYEANTYFHDPTLSNVAYLWWAGYKIINGCNIVIESVEEGLGSSSDQILGENYFLRALMHAELVKIFARPYSQGPSNPGIIIRTSSAPTETVRATVGAVYDQILTDLEKAAELMNEDRGPSFANKIAAYALLSRIYLYMGENQLAVDYANQVLELKPASSLEPTSTFSSYFANAISSTETIFCVEHTDVDNKAQASIASMYLKDGIGWGEVYPSKTYIDLLEQHPEDQRNAFIWPQYIYDNEGNLTFWISYTELSDDNNNLSYIHYNVTRDEEQGKWVYTLAGTDHFVNEEINGTDTTYYIMVNAQRQDVELGYRMSERNSYPRVYIKKFSYQNGDPMLSSPVMLRLAEVILNRAEANAKLGRDQQALDDVNLIRQRAGLTGEALFRTDHMMGYTSILDIVLDERRLELAFEGHRTHDIYRNHLPMNRIYPGIQPAEIIQPNDNRIVFPIPQDEILTSGIQQNP